MESIFYMVYLSGERGPTYKHSTLESAEKEAKRLAKQYGKKAYILISLKSYEINEFKETIIFKEDDLPF